jgi:Domain of unknown function (DUF1707)/2TM domain
MHDTTSDRSPAPTAAGHLRVSDSEREHAATRLREHASAGRLTMDELAGRLETALAARTQEQLDALFDDLPAQGGEPSSRARAKAAGVRTHARAYLWVSLGLIAIWAATGLGYFWPMWPMLGWGIGLVSHTRACGFGLRVPLR